MLLSGLARASERRGRGGGESLQWNRQAGQEAGTQTGHCPPATPNEGAQATAYSVRSVRRESGMEECGNTLGVQAPSEPLERSVVDHSTT